MIEFHPQYVVDANAKRQAVLIPLEEWERIVEALEELDDIRLYDEAQRDPSETIPFDQALREIDSESAT